LVEKVPGGSEYGPLAAIYSVAEDDITNLQALAEERAAIAMALVYNVDGGNYDPLDITGDPRTYHCLYVQVQGNAVKAWMEQRDPEDCARNNVRPVSAFSPLNVLHGRVVRSPHAHGPDDYPDVARWDDAMNGQTGIVLACVSDGYCEIFPRGSGSLVDRWDPMNPGHPRDRRTTIKGWYDQQHLAVDETNRGGRPGAVTGVLVPHESLGEWSVADFQPSDTSTWRVVAWQLMDEQVDKYADGFNWHRTGLGSPDEVSGNEIALCWGVNPADESEPPEVVCRIPSSDIPTCTAWHGRTEDLWFARITNPDGVVAYRCVDRESHSGLDFEIPGVVRFRWAVNDEKAWIRCGMGCCSVEP